MARHAVRHAAQDPVEALLAVRPEDDEIRAPFLGAGRNRLPRIAVA